MIQQHNKKCFSWTLSACSLKVPVSIILIWKCKETYQQGICIALQNVNQPFVLCPFCELACMHESRTKIDSTENTLNLALRMIQLVPHLLKTSNIPIVNPPALSGVCQPLTSCFCISASIDLTWVTFFSHIIPNPYLSFIGHYFIHMAKCTRANVAHLTWWGSSRLGSKDKLEALRYQPPPADWNNHYKETKVVSHLELTGLHCCLPKIMRHLSLRE